MVLKDKRGIIFGVTNKRSIAWGIAQKFYDEGAKLILTYQNEKIGQHVKRLASELNYSSTIGCDVSLDYQIDQVFQHAQNRFGMIDFVVHCIAYTSPEEFKKPYYAISRESFLRTLDISAYSLTAIAKKAAPLMTRGGSIIALTSLGGWQVIPHYHIMGVAKAALDCSVRYLANDLGRSGIRVNGISSGPIKTVSAVGIPRFSKILKTHKDRSPIGKDIKPSDIGDAAVFLASDAAKHVTGDTIFVDCGYHIVGI